MYTHTCTCTLTNIQTYKQAQAFLLGVVSSTTNQTTEYGFSCMFQFLHAGMKRLLSNGGQSDKEEFEPFQLALMVVLTADAECRTDTP